MVIAVIHIFKKETTFSHELIYIQIHNNIGSIRNIAVKNGELDVSSYDHFKDNTAKITNSKYHTKIYFIFLKYTNFGI